MICETSAEQDRAIAGVINRLWRANVKANTQVIEYAPPAHRGSEHEIPVKEVAATTDEIDEIIRAAKDEIAELERSALVVRNLYVEHTRRISAHIKRLRDGVRLSMETMQALRDQCVALDDQHKDGLERKDIAEIAAKFGAGHETNAG